MHIMFFANDLLLTVYIYFRYRNDLKQKANSSNFFLFECKMGCKVGGTIRNINNTFGPGTANECQCSGGS